MTRTRQALSWLECPLFHHYLIILSFLLSLLSNPPVPYLPIPARPLSLSLSFLFIYHCFSFSHSSERERERQLSNNLITCCLLCYSFFSSSSKYIYSLYSVHQWITRSLNIVENMISLLSPMIHEIILCGMFVTT